MSSLSGRKTQSESQQRQEGRRWGIYVMVVGLACLGFGLYGVIESIWLGIRAELATATVVEIDHSGDVASDILEFTIAERQHRVAARGAFGVTWGPSRGLRSHVPILYFRERPEGARLADFEPRFAIPFILLILGSLFTPAGLLVRRRGWVLDQNS